MPDGVTFEPDGSDGDGSGGGGGGDSGDGRRALPRGLPLAVRALKSAQGAAGLTNVLIAIGLLQLCCVGGPVGDANYDERWRHVLAVTAVILSLAGAIVAMPCPGFFRRGVGGRKDGHRWNNIDGRIVAGTAAQPKHLPRIYSWGAGSAILIALSEVCVLIAISNDLGNLGPLAVLATILLVVSGLAAMSLIGGYWKHATVLRRLPPPVSAPPGALPAKGSLESVAIWFARNARQACAIGGVGGVIAFLILLVVGVFGRAPATLAVLPITGFAAYACYRGHAGIDLGLHTRDHRIRVGLLWGLAGGVAGSLPVGITLVVFLGAEFGAWPTGLSGMPPLIQRALGQPMGICFSPFILPMGMCGITLGAFSRELETRKSAADRLVEQQQRDAS